MTLMTALGPPASSSSSAMASAVRGVSEAGFRITVQPAANAGPILRVAIAAGKFHGVTRIDTPTGCCNTKIRLVPPGLVEISEILRTASSEYQRKNSAA